MTIECHYDAQACTCTYNGNKYPPGNTIYNTTDGHGNCITAVCGNDGTIDKESYPCPVPTLTTSMSIATTTTASHSSTTFVFTSTTPELVTVTVTRKSTPETPSISTAKPPVKPTTTESVTETSCQETFCYWSRWISSDYPEYGPGRGDNETIKHIIQRGYNICDNPVAVVCQAVHYPGVPLDELGQTVTCNNQGLLCKNSLQNPPMCYNYEIKVSNTINCPYKYSNFNTFNYHIRSTFQHN
ncbi:mucin-5AC-like [Thunnus maccoyii]|uniref:mucin-5AC-like n=1 Tax=Thunnus maccoyii TaxID=8240 RepID=UPI001C4B9F61|nr:mucin-5AC-like [Thunnus maccoyii]